MRKWLALALLFMFTGIITTAQDEPDRLPPYSSVVGNLPPGGTESWSFNAVDGEIVSLMVEATSSIDPVLTVLSETGAVLVTQDDYDYPNSRNAIIQSLTIPFTGTYSVQVSAYGNTSGSYTLTRLRGFAQGANLSGFSADDDWMTENEALDMSQSAGQITLTLEGIGETGGVTNPAAARLDDYYVQVDVEILLGRGGWEVHLRHHQQSEDRYYQYSVNDQGFWRYLVRDGGEETVLRNWISHPAIVPGATSFDIGLMANGVGYDLFYDGSLVGSFSDETLSGGVIGIGVGTGQTIDAAVEARFENLRITVPASTTDGDELLPERLILSDPVEMARALGRRRVIPTGGDLALNVPESSAQSNDAGVSRLPLGRGTTYENFVMSTEATITAAVNGVHGCGIFFRGTGEEDYVLAFIDSASGYGLATREGDGFLPGVFGERTGLGESEHHLLVTAVDDNIRYYIDGIYVGDIEANAIAGAVGNTVVNYDANTTVCNFENTWVWTWDDTP